MTPNEQLIRGALNGRAVRFDPADGIEIDADTLRSLLLGKADGCDGDCPARVSVSGARILGRLDLRDLQRPDGTPLPSLELIQCTFDTPIDISHASLRRLSLAGSRFELLNAREARFDASVDLAGVGPLEEDGYCRIDLQGTRIGGGLEAPRAQLRAPIRRISERDEETGDVLLALDLRMARIEADVMLQPGFRAFGGVSMSRSHIGGTLWMSGAHLQAGEGYAFNGQTARTDGGMVLGPGQDAHGLPTPFVARGLVQMYGISVGGAVAMPGAVLEPAPLPAGMTEEELGADYTWSGLNLSSGTVEGDLNLSVGSATGPDGEHEFPAVVDGGLWLDFASIRGTLNLDGCRITQGLLGAHAQIDGDVSLTVDGQRAPAVRDLTLTDARIGGSVSVAGVAGSLDLGRAQVGKHLWIGGRVENVSLMDGSLGGDLNLSESSSVRSLTLHDTTVNGNLALRGVVGVPYSNKQAISGIGLQLGGGIDARDATVHGNVYLRESEIRRTFLLLRTSVRGHLEAPRIKVDGDVEFTTVLLGNRTSLRQAQIGGHLKLEDVGVVWSGNWRQPAVIDLGDARVQSEITIHRAPAAAEHGLSSGGERVRGAGILAMRSRALSFFPGWRLVEAVVDPARIRQLGEANAATMKQPGVVGFLWRRGRLGRSSETILLTGNSTPIYELTEREPGSFRLESRAAAAEYARFFTSYSWANLGAYRAIEPNDPRLSRVTMLEPEDGGEVWTVEPVDASRTEGGTGQGGFLVNCSVLYGSRLSSALISVSADGSVTIRGAQPRGDLTGPPVDSWISPFRFSEVLDEPIEKFPPTLGSASSWRRESGRRASQIGHDLLTVLKRPVTKVGLEDARADRLDDLDGRGWSGNPLLQLDGFTYDRAHGSRDRETNLLGEVLRSRQLQRMRREDGVYGCARLRRRQLHSHPGWWIAEVATVFRTAENEDRRGVASFLWSRNTGAPSVRALPGDRARQSVVGWLLLHENELQLDSEAAILDYVRLQCVAGGHGRLIEEADPALGDAPNPEQTVSSTEGHCVSVTTLDEDGIGVCVFEISEDGEVTRTAEAPRAPARRGWREAHVGPFRTVEDDDDPHPDDFAGSAWGAGGDWQELLPSDNNDAREEAGVMLREFVPAIRSLLEEDYAAEALHRPAKTPRPLSAWLARVADTVRSGGVGRGVRRLFARLDGRAASRLAWLRLQYPTGRATEEFYHSHPYEVLATALRNEGADREARRILSEKLRNETRIEKWTRKPGRKAFNFFFGIFFDFGLSTGRALLVTLGLLGVGWGATAWLNDSGMLVVDFTPSATVVIESPGGADGAPTREMALGVAEPGRAEARVLCGDNISNLVFAADYMVPILEFGQRHRCQIAGARPPGETGWWLSPAGWQVGLVLYSIMGAIFVSITLLTVSGVLRRRAES